MRQSNLITDEIVLNALDDFKNKYSGICNTIRVTEYGCDVPLVDFIDEIKNNTEAGKKFKEQLVEMALLSMSQLFK